MKTQNDPRPKAPAFTLVEFLVLTAVLSILAAILLPALSDAKANARAAFCINNLKQWGVGFQMYANDWNGYLPLEGDFGNQALNSLESWFNGVPPYLKMQQYKNSPGQGGFIAPFSNLRIWMCPEKNLRNPRSVTGKNACSYAMNDLLDAQNAPGSIPFPNMKHVKWSAITSPQITVLLFDTYANSPEGDPVAASGQYPYQNLHTGGANFLFVDGHVANFPTSAYFDGSNGITNNPALKWWPYL